MEECIYCCATVIFRVAFSACFRCMCMCICIDRTSSGLDANDTGGDNCGNLKDKALSAWRNLSDAVIDRASLCYYKLISGKKDDWP